MKWCEYITLANGTGNWNTMFCHCFTYLGYVNFLPSSVFCIICIFLARWDSDCAIHRCWLVAVLPTHLGARDGDRRACVPWYGSQIYVDTYIKCVSFAVELVIYTHFVVPYVILHFLILSLELNNLSFINIEFSLLVYCSCDMLVVWGAVVAREYGLPCVVNVSNATVLFNSGHLCYCPLKCHIHSLYFSLLLFPASLLGILHWCLSVVANCKWNYVSQGVTPN